jgi:hypothetical protein
MNKDNEFEVAFSENRFWSKMKRYAKSAGTEVVEKALLLFYAAQEKRRHGPKAPSLLHWATLSYRSTQSLTSRPSWDMLMTWVSWCWRLRQWLPTLMMMCEQRRQKRCLNGLVTTRMTNRHRKVDVAGFCDKAIVKIHLIVDCRILTLMQGSFNPNV